MVRIGTKHQTVYLALALAAIYMFTKQYPQETCFEINTCI